MTLPPKRLFLASALLSLLTYFPVGYHYSVLNVAYHVYANLVNESCHELANLWYKQDNSPVTELLSNQTITVVTALILVCWQIGASFGSLSACWIMDKFGRKTSLLIISVRTNCKKYCSAPIFSIYCFRTFFKLRVAR